MVLKYGLEKKYLLYILFKVPWLKNFIKRKYYRVNLGLLITNFFFQKILRINSVVNFLVHYTSQVIKPENIFIEEGEFSYTVYLSFAISGNCYIQGGNGIYFGEGTIFAPGVKIISANHDFKDYKNWVISKPIKIGKFCWIGSNAVLLPGVTLGNHVIVGAGAVVTKSFPAYTIVAGNPAKIIGFLCRNCLIKLRKEGNMLKCPMCGYENYIQEGKK